jgi:cyclopropane-fatty-acyl-phospholipid synthase
MDRLLQGMFARIIRHGTLTVSTRPGYAFTVGDGTRDPITISFADSWSALKVLLDPELRLGEAYMDGELCVEQGSLTDFLALGVRNLSDRSPGLWTRLLRACRGLERRAFESNSFLRSLRNVRHHYDIDDRIYRLFLDSDRQYSCAYFERADMDLEHAQEAKRRHIAKKLLLKPGHSVLDIGSGWGGLALGLAEYQADVLGVTLSREQLQVARERARAIDQDRHVHFELVDYRNVTSDTSAGEGETSDARLGLDYQVTSDGDGPNALRTSRSFDRIVSVGMFEHVGKPYYGAFFRKCYELLAEDGVMLLHTIGRLDGPFGTNPWVWRYVFPGGYTPALSELTPIIERSGFIVTDIEVLRVHYAQTLHAWRTKFMEKQDEVVRLFSEDVSLRKAYGSAQRFIRMWEYYLAGFEVSFCLYGLAVFQIQLAKKIDVVPLTRDYLYANDNVDAHFMHAAE